MAATFMPLCDWSAGPRGPMAPLACAQIPDYQSVTAMELMLKSDVRWVGRES